MSNKCRAEGFGEFRKEISCRSVRAVIHEDYIVRRQGFRDYALQTSTNNFERIVHANNDVNGFKTLLRFGSDVLSLKQQATAFSEPQR